MWRPLAGLAVAAALAAAGCGSQAQATSAVPGDVSGNGSTTGACDPVQKRIDGTCCPAGAFFAFESGTCEAVGPPECAEVIFSDPDKCAPRWCWDWRTDPEPGKGKACVRDELGCEIVGRLCTAAELVEGRGCLAGDFPASETPGDCVPAGVFPGSGVPADWDGTAETLPPVPPLEDSIPPGVPPLVALPDVEDMFFCVDEGTGESRFCTAEELKVCTRGADGALPDPKKCLYVGVPWASRYCPPGFVVDTAAVVAKGELPPCLPDPADCPAGEYAGAGAGDADVFVHGGKGNDGWPGTMSKPVRTIGKALALAPVGGNVVVAPGVYAESVVIDKPVSLRGHCAAEVRVAGVAGKAVVRVDGTAAAGGEAYVSGLRLGGPWFGVMVVGSLPVRLKRVFVVEATVAGVLVGGATASVQAGSLVVVGTRSRQGDLKFGRGMSVEQGAEVTLQDVRLSGNREVGLSVRGVGSILGAIRVLIDGTLPRQSDETGGRGVGVELGAQVALQDVRLSRNRDAGLSLGDAGTTLSATRLLVDGTLPRKSDEKFGRGVGVELGAQVALQDVRLSGNRDAGLSLSDAGTKLGATRLLIDATLPRKSDEKFGWGMSVWEGGQMTLQDVRLSANRDLGCFVGGVNTTLSATRLLVDGTLPRQSDQTFGRGLNLQSGAQVALHDVRLSANRDVGVFVGGAGTTFSATRLLIDGTLPQQSDKRHGSGMNVNDGAQVALQDVRLSANRDFGLLVSDAGATLAATRLLIDGTLARQSNEAGGGAVVVQLGAQVALQDVRLSANRDIGLQVISAGATLGSTGLLVDGTLPRQSDLRFGRGLGVQDGAHLGLNGVRLVANHEAGLYESHSTLRATGLAVLATTAAASDQSGGFGIWLVGATHTAIVASAIKTSHAAAVVADQSEAQIHGSVLSGTAWGDWPEVGLDGVFTGKTATLADGILLNTSPNFLIDRMSQWGNCNIYIYMGGDFKHCWGQNQYI